MEKRGKHHPFEQSCLLAHFYFVNPLAINGIFFNASSGQRSYHERRRFYFSKRVRVIYGALFSVQFSRAKKYRLLCLPLEKGGDPSRRPGATAAFGHWERVDHVAHLQTHDYREGGVPQINTHTHTGTREGYGSVKQQMARA